MSATSKMRREPATIAGSRLVKTGSRLRGRWRSSAAPAYREVRDRARPLRRRRWPRRRRHRRRSPRRARRCHRGARSASALPPSIARVVSTSAASRSWLASISARASRSPVEVAKAGDRRPADRAAADLDQAARLLVTTSLKGSPRSRRRAIELLKLLATPPSATNGNRRRRSGRPVRRRQAEARRRSAALRRGDPSDETLIFLVDERLGAIDGRLRSPTSARNVAFSASAPSAAGERHDADDGEGGVLTSATIVTTWAGPCVPVDQREWPDVGGGARRDREDGNACCPRNPQRFPAMPEHAETPFRRRVPILKGLAFDGASPSSRNPHAQRKSGQCRRLMNPV